MTSGLSPSDSGQSKRSPYSRKHPNSRQRPLNFGDRYTCPACRHGEITGLTLMDAFACNFCRHIFTANLSEQSVQVADSVQPMIWRWTGWNWQSAYQADPNLTTFVWLIAGMLVVLPTGIVWLSSYTFPPLPGSPWAWFPVVWVSITLSAHLLMVGWLLAEHYQFPPYISSKVRLRHLLDRF
ncbi:MAG: hypothetical protein Fur0046_39110 [Cyanobacteria bacterium J069]